VFLRLLSAYLVFFYVLNLMVLGVGGLLILRFIIKEILYLKINKKS